MQISQNLVTQVNLFLESGDRTFLSSMKNMERNSLEGQATVRFLMQKKHWPFTPDSEFSDLLSHLFAAYPDRPTIDPETYRASTFQMIKDAWDYECEIVVPEIKEKPAKAAPKPRKESTRRISKSSTDMVESADSDLDTTGASDRLKKVIAIQRNS